MSTFLRFPSGQVIESENPEYHPEAERLTKAEGKRARQAYARLCLLELLKPGDKVYTILRHVSRSGMSRRIDCYAWIGGDKRYLSAYVADLLGYPCKREGITVDGCGMDMGFHLVYNLSHALFHAQTEQGEWVSTFECIGKGCPSNDHSNGDRNFSPDHVHSDGGYALRHEWL